MLWMKANTMHHNNTRLTGQTGHACHHIHNTDKHNAHTLASLTTFRSRAGTATLPAHRRSAPAAGTREDTTPPALVADLRLRKSVDIFASAETHVLEKIIKFTKQHHHHPPPTHDPPTHLNHQPTTNHQPPQHPSPPVVVVLAVVHVVVSLQGGELCTLSRV
jgi:hypothetical protein